MCLLAFLASGNTTDRGDHKGIVRRGVAWLSKQQGRDGAFPLGAAPLATLEHALATFALAEAGAMARDENEKVLAAAKRAFDHLLWLRHPDGGWPRQGREPFSDPMTTAWSIFTCQAAGKLLRKTWDRAPTLAWLGKATGADGSLEMASAGKGQQARQVEQAAATAAALFARFFLGQDPRQEKVMFAAANRIVDGLGDDDTSADPLFRCMASHAAYQLGHNQLRPVLWARWERVVLPAWAMEQQREGRQKGSWKPHGGWDTGRSRTLITALNVMAQTSRFR
ncbi:MAG: hypothetical protein V3U11_09445, partial [Planctomycetota bacterium]